MDEDDDLWEGREYFVDHTPWGVAQGEIVMSLRESDDGRVTRRLLRWHSAIKDGRRGFAIDLCAQRKGRHDRWEDSNFNLATLQAGAEVRLDLDQEQTRLLRNHLNHLFQVTGLIDSDRSDTYRVHSAGLTPVPTDIAEIVLALVNGGEPKDAVRHLVDLAPHLASAAGLTHQHIVRQAALQDFGVHLEQPGWTEHDWQRFFEANQWIFGHGLDYRFLVTEQPQPSYGGAGVTRTGGQRGDFLLASSGDARFSVLVEIKRPDTDLVQGYRNGAWRISDDVAGGVAQLQANCDQWELRSHQSPDLEWSLDHNLTTATPMGILVIGRTGSLVSPEGTTVTRERRESFERFRRHLWNPEVITFDELYARARFIVERRTGDPAETYMKEPEHPSDDRDEDEFDDLPF